MDLFVSHHNRPMMNMFTMFYSVAMGHLSVIYTHNFYFMEWNIWISLFRIASQSYMLLQYMHIQYLHLPQIIWLEIGYRHIWSKCYVIWCYVTLWYAVNLLCRINSYCLCLFIFYTVLYCISLPPSTPGN